MKLNARDVECLEGAVQSYEVAGKRHLTSWWVLTGPPGSGKTTMADAFQKIGWTVVGDPGRAEFESLRATGVEPAAARENYLDFQRRVLRRTMNSIRNLPMGQRVIFDYGIAEALAFMRVAGIEWDDEIIAAAARYRFNKVFLHDAVLRDIPASDPIRIESGGVQETLRQLIEEIYVALGHQPVRIPAMPHERRFKFILNYHQMELKSPADGTP